METREQRRARARAYELARMARHKERIGHGYGGGCCKRCGGLPHRVEGERCKKCGLAYQAERIG